MSKKVRAEAEADSRFFHRKQFVQLFWGLVIAGIAGVTGVAWQRREGPQQVVVLNRDTTTRVIVATDTSQRRLMAELLREVQSQRRVRPSIQTAVPTSPLGLESRVPNELSPVHLPSFSLPTEAKGYRLESLSVFARSECPAESQLPGADVALTLKLRVPGDTGRLSPIHVMITRRESPNTGGMQLFSQQYDLRASSIVVVPLPRAVGALELSFGVFSLRELSTTYPPFYRTECRIRIQE